MTEVFVGQIMMSGFAFAPRGFALCNGQTLPISQNQALFSLLLTRFGGNGQTTFCLPNLQGQTPVAFGPSADGAWQPTPYGLGATGGAESVTLTTDQIPAHKHQGQGRTVKADKRVAGNMLYADATLPIYAPTGENQVHLGPGSVAPVGGGAPHSNMQPYSVLSFSIALQGIYPSRN